MRGGSRARRLCALGLIAVAVVAVAQRDNVSVTSYCKAFAKAYAEANALDYRERSARTEKRSNVIKWLSNVFSPADSRFTAGYDCRFETTTGQRVSVGLFLTGTREFAEYAQWEGLQLVPIRYVNDNRRAGYGVFKYLDLEQQRDS